MELVELHGTDHGLLEEWAGGAALVRRSDGLAALVHRLPPPERRGVALIDPSYEIKSDYEAVVAALARAHRRFATGVFLLWYPVIERDRTEALMTALTATGIPRQLRLELSSRPDASRPRHDRRRADRGQPALDVGRCRRQGLPWLAAALGANAPPRVDWLIPPAE